MLGLCTPLLMIKYVLIYCHSRFFLPLQVLLQAVLEAKIFGIQNLQSQVSNVKFLTGFVS